MPKGAVAGEIASGITGMFVPHLLRSEMNDIVTDRVEDQVTEGVTMESFHDVGAMCFDCFDAQIEQSGYFFARFAFRKKLNNLSLARS